MKSDTKIVLLFLAMVVSIMAVPFKQHPKPKDQTLAPKLSNPEYFQQLKMKNVLPGEILLPIQPGEGIQKSEWLRKMNKLGGIPNGIPGQPNVTIEQYNRLNQQQDIIGSESLHEQNNGGSRQHVAPFRLQKLLHRRPVITQGRINTAPRVSMGHGIPNKVC